MTATMRSSARVETELGRQYMTQLCKHMGHRLKTVIEGDEGRIAFPSGPCRLSATADSLAVEIDAELPETLDRLEEVVSSHINRFAFRNPLAFVWTRQTV